MTSQQEVSLKEFLEVQLRLMTATVERRLDKTDVIIDDLRKNMATGKQMDNVVAQLAQLNSAREEHGGRIAKLEDFKGMAYKFVGSVVLVIVVSVAIAWLTGMLGL